MNDELLRETDIQQRYEPNNIKGRVIKNNSAISDEFNNAQIYSLAKERGKDISDVIPNDVCTKRSVAILSIPHPGLS